MKLELLAPAGDLNKLYMAAHFGADAVYFAGKKFGLRTFAGNFSDDDIIIAVDFLHSLNKKAYVTINALLRDDDFIELEKYVRFLYNSNVDAVIVADFGVFSFIRRVVPDLDIHISTQANTVNSFTANEYYRMGAKRIVLARELSLNEIDSFRKNIPSDLEIEAFVQGAMCISYSGRCLLSNFFMKRDANRGACVQACRWKYELREEKRENTFPIAEDKYGSYIMNSKDMCMIEYIDKLASAGITSFKIEGRMKTEYYVANVINAYRRAIDLYYKDESNFVLPPELKKELYKSSHRGYSTGFYFDTEGEIELENSQTDSTHNFVAIILEDSKDGKVLIEMRNRFAVNDVLEILSPYSFNQTIKIEKMESLDGEEILDAKNVQQKIYLYTGIDLKKNDILRKEVN